MKKKTSPLTLNVKAEGYAMNAQLICEDSQGNKVELTSKGTNRINLGMVRWFSIILLLITWAEVFWDSCFGRQFMFQDSNVQSCGKKWCENAWGLGREKAVPFFPSTTPFPDRAHLIFAWLVSRRPCYLRAWYRLCFGNYPASCEGQSDSLWVSYQLSGSSVFSQSERLLRT